MAAEETTVYSVRLNRKDVDALKAVAERSGMKVGEAIRQAVSNFRGQSRPTTIEVTTPAGTPSAVTVSYRDMAVDARTSDGGARAHAKIEWGKSGQPA